MKQRSSAFTPFRRWFTDERLHELVVTRQNYERIRKKYQRSEWHTKEGLKELLTTLDYTLDELSNDALPSHLRRAFQNWYIAFVDQHKALEFEDTIDWKRDLSLSELVEIRETLRLREHFLENKDDCLDLFFGVLHNVMKGYIETLPPIETEGRALVTLPLISLFPDAHDLLNRTIGTFEEDAFVEHGIFVQFRNRVYRNVYAFIGDDPDNPKKDLPRIRSLKFTPVEGVELLAGTPFYDLLLTPVPLAIPDELFYSHTYCVAGSGAGKTQWISTFILNSLKQDNPPSLVVVDSQGDLIHSIAGLSEIQDRVILIDPKDIDHPPAINVFDVNMGRIDAYDQVTREQVYAGAIETLDYLFSGIVGAELTAKQNVFFRFVARLMLELPATIGRNATLRDLLDLMDDHAPYAQAIARLPEIQRRFFEKDFPSKTFSQTKEQVRYRLNAVLENPTLQRLFTAKATKLDLFSELDNGSIILIDTAKDFLKGTSAHFGRIFIALVLQAILERAAQPEAGRKPTLVIVDEAHEYFDQNIDDLLTQVRKYKCGCVFSHQYVDQASQSLKASFAANTSIKLVSGVSTADARRLAPDLRTTAEFILDQPPLQFAFYARGVTKEAICLPVEPGLLQQEPRMSEEEYVAFRERNRERVSIVEPELGDELRPEDEPPGALSDDDKEASDPREDVRHTADDGIDDEVDVSPGKWE